MRSTTPLLAAGLAVAVASQALAQGAGAPTSPGGGAASPPMTSPSTSPTDANPSPSSKPSTSSTTTPSTEAAQPGASTAPSANGSSAPASATAPGGAAQATAPPSFTVGETVKDNTGATIGTISSLSGSGASQMAVIKMGDQSFQVQANRLGSNNGAAEINMTKAQISGMLKK